MADPQLILPQPGAPAEVALDAWLHHLAHERRLSPRTLEAYGHAGCRYLGFLAGHRGEALTGSYTPLTLPTILRASVPVVAGSVSSLDSRRTHLSRYH